MSACCLNCINSKSLQTSEPEVNVFLRLPPRPTNGNEIWRLGDQKIKVQSNRQTFYRRRVAEELVVDEDGHLGDLPFLLYPGTVVDDSVEVDGTETGLQTLRVNLTWRFLIRSRLSEITLIALIAE